METKGDLVINYPNLLGEESEPYYMSPTRPGYNEFVNGLGGVTDLVTLLSLIFMRSIHLQLPLFLFDLGD